ncbi:MAG: sigma-70 family RNA polymerase sigma factor [bacterium]|nr:sigma-70 family RNA polymerase sigma factor [bacterium]
MSLIARLSEEADGVAWAEFWIRYGDLIRGFCIRRGLQAADIDDIAQDVMLSLTKAMPGFQYDPAKGLFRSYLKTVVIHAIGRKFGQKRLPVRLQATETEPVPDGPDDEPHWEAEWRRYHYRRAMMTLENEFTDRDRDIFHRYATLGQPVAAVAADFSLSEAAIYQIKTRFLRRLTETIRTQVADEG